MKKILIILLTILSIPVIGQSYYTISKTDVTGSDTTIYLRNGKHNLFTIDFTQTNANTSTVDIGLSDDKVSFVSVDTPTMPVTLSKVTYTKLANGYTRNRLCLMSGDWMGTYIAVKITFVNVTVGTYKITY